MPSLHALVPGMNLSKPCEFRDPSPKEGTGAGEFSFSPFPFAPLPACTGGETAGGDGLPSDFCWTPSAWKHNAKANELKIYGYQRQTWIFVWKILYELEMNCTIKSLFFVFFSYKKYSCSRWTILTMSFILFWALTVLFTWQSMGLSQASRFSSKYLTLCSEDEQSFYGFVTTWGKVINYKTLILGWSNPLTKLTWLLSILFELYKYTRFIIHVHYHLKVNGWYDFNVFEQSLLWSPRLNLFDQKHSKTVLLWNIMTT